ncbi:MAG: hypothetical protein MPJ06_05535 [Nitrosopumilus sp.]|nr:hypothetical protein [Nitrosopumilus sp.]
MQQDGAAQGPARTTAGRRHLGISHMSTRQYATGDQNAAKEAACGSTAHAPPARGTRSAPPYRAP